MPLRRTRQLDVFLGLGLLLLLAATQLPESHSEVVSTSSRALGAPDGGTAWRIFPSPNFGSGNNELYGVSVASANDVWAVGRYDDTGGYKTLSMHWDGNAWSIVPTPNVGSSFNQLFSVAAVSSNNAWAVGASSNENVLFQPLIAHWDGSQWSIVPAALAPGSSAFLYGIAAIAADDIWAVGYIQVGFSAQQPLIMHWDGSSWSLVPSPSTSPANHDILWAVSALSASNVWASGSSTDAVTGNYATFIQHWDGSAWNIVPSPNPSGSIYNFVWGIEAVSASDIWVMGRAYDGSAYPSLIERWDGSAWSITPSPSEQFYNELYDAAALSSTDVWAVGRSGGGFDNNVAMVMHWDGSAWSVVANPDPPGATENNFLYSVAAVSAQDVWAVGSYFKDQRFQTLIERYSNLPCLTASAVVSRKTHGNGRGTFDIDLPLTGTPGIECRAPLDSSVGSVVYKLVFTFPDLLASVGSVSASATGTAQPGPSSGSIDSNDAHRYIVNLSGLPNAQYVTVTLTNAHDAVGRVGDVAVTFGLLVGDVNASGRVDSGDVFLVRQQSLQDATASNFRDDINSSGRIDSGDVFLTRQQSLTSLP